MGRQTRRQAFETGFWYRIAFHFHRTLGTNLLFQAHIDDTTGRFSIQVKKQESPPFLTITSGNSVAQTLLHGLKDLLTNHHAMRLHPIPLKSIVKISLTKNQDLELKLFLQFTDTDGNTRLYDGKAMERFRSGFRWYLKDKGVFAELSGSDTLFEKFDNRFRRVVGNKKIPLLLDRFGEGLWDGAIIDPSVKNIRIFKKEDNLELFSHTLERDWLFLSVHYGFGDSRISLLDILEAKKSGYRFLPVSGGWVDCRSFDTDRLGRIPGSPIFNRMIEGENPLKLNKLDLFRLAATSDTVVKISWENPSDHGAYKPSERARVGQSSFPCGMPGHGHESLAGKDPCPYYRTYFPPILWC